MPFTSLYTHLVWSTKDRKPYLTDQIQEHMFPYMRGIVENLRATLDSINGTMDHVPMLARVPPSLSISEFTLERFMSCASI